MLRKIFIIALLFCSYNSLASTTPIDQAEQAPQQIDHIKQAKDFLKNISDEAIELTNDKSLSSEQLNRKLNEMFNGYVNTEWMAKFVLGRHWNAIDPTMKAHFITVYHDYLTNTYLPKLKNYTIGTSVNIESASQLAASDYMVFTRLNRPNQQSIEVDYRLKLSDDKHFDIVDIIAEGVSLLNTQRTEFSSIIEQDGINDLINSLKKIAGNPRR